MRLMLHADVDEHRRAVEEVSGVKVRLAQWLGRWRERRVVHEQTRQTSAARQAARTAEAQRQGPPYGQGGG